MKKSIKATRTNFLTHEALIVQGEGLTVQGWVNVALEAKQHKSVAEYAKVSAKNSTQHSANTIRQYASFVIAGIKRYGSADKMLNAYDAVYSYRSIADLRSFVGSTSTKAKRASRFSAQKVAKQLKSKYSSEQLKAIKACL